MKARYVYESVNFKRGQDPKDAMNIGRFREIKKGEEFYAIFKFRRSNNSAGYHNDVLHDLFGTTVTCIATIDERGHNGRSTEAIVEETGNSNTWLVNWDDHRNEWIIK